MIRRALSMILPFLCVLGTTVVQAQPAPGEAEPRQKVAVVLGGGGAHGVAHLGVLRELEKQRVPIDLVVGNGFGGLVGGLYASGMTVDEIEDFLFDTDWDNIFNPDTRREDLSFRRKQDDQDFLIKYRVGVKDGQAKMPVSLVPHEKLAQLLQSVTADTKGVEEFDSLPIPFRTVGMDLLSGEDVVLDSGSLDRAILTSLSAPGILPPVRVDDKLLITGSLVNNLPVDVARQWGADVVIVVDIGPYIAPEEELNSIFAIVDQVDRLLQHRNSQASIGTMGDSDILVQLDLSPRKLTAVENPREYIERGVTTTASMAGRFEGIRLGEQQFALLNDERVAGRSQAPIISTIELSNDTRVDDAVILAQLTQKLDQPLDKEALDQDLRNIFGIGSFSVVEFNLRDEGATSVLEIRTVEDDAGDRFWRFGISLQDDLEGNSAYTGSASMTWTNLNRLGGEWRNVFRLGERQQISTEFYQPIVKSGRVFVAVGGGYVERNVNAFAGGEIIGQVRVQETTGTMGAGRIFGNSGQVTAGIFRGTGSTSPNIGSGLSSSDFDVGGFTASAAYDTFDNIYFPRKGSQAVLGWVGQRESVGADIDVDIASGSISTAKSWGDNTLIGDLSVQSQLNEVAGVQNLLTTGGLFRLSGYQRDELSGRHTAVAAAIYFRSLRTNPLRGFLNATLYAGASLELGNAWQDSSEVSFSNTITAGSVFLGADTFIGPVYLAGGLAEGGNSAFYLYVGRPF